MSKANQKAATKRKNRKIHARKFRAAPEGKAWLESERKSSWHERLTTCFRGDCMKSSRYDCNTFRVIRIWTWIQSRNLTEHTSMRGVQTSPPPSYFSWSSVKMLLINLV